MYKHLILLLLLAVISLLASGCAGPVEQFIAAYKHNRELVAEANREKAAEKKDEQARQTRDQADYLAQVNRGEKPIIIDYEALLDGSYEGSTCDGKYDIDLKIYGATDDRLYRGRLVRVYGRFHATGPGGRSIDSYVQGRFNLYAGYLTLYAAAPPTLKDIIQNTSMRGMRDYAIAKENSYTKNNFEKLTGVEMQPGDAALPPPALKLNIAVARDSKGEGWVGSFQSDGFSQCHEIKFHSDDGKNTQQLPPVTGLLARKRVNYYPFMTNSGKMYWLGVAKKFGDTDASYLMGDTYEKMATKSPQYYKLAAQSYLEQANQYHDARAQMALSRLYAKGLGVPRDLAESRHWHDLARVQYREAGRICTNPKIIAKALDLMKAEGSDPAIKMMKVVGLMVGMYPDFGTPVIKSVSLYALTSIKDSYQCKIVAQNIGASINDYTPDLKYAGRDKAGNDLYVDNTMEKEMRQNLAAFTTKASQQPYARSLTITPGVNGFYQLILDPSAELSRKYSAMVNLPSSDGGRDILKVKTPISRLVKIEEINGTGKVAKKGDTVVVSDDSWVYEPNSPNHKGFHYYSTVDFHQPPLVIKLGSGKLHPMELGIEGMRENGMRIVLVPPSLGYGKKGYKQIPPNATLMYEIKLLKVR